MTDVGSTTYVGAFLVLSVLALLVAIGFRIQDLMLAGLVLGLYALHLLRIKSLQDQVDDQTATIDEVASSLDELYGGNAGSPAQPAASRPGAGAPSSPSGSRQARPSEPSAGAAGSDAHSSSSSRTSSSPRTTGEESGDETVALDLRLGTVAIVENTLDPEQVSKVLAAQEREPERKFGELAVEAGMIDEDEVERLLEIQRRGVYSRPKVQSAKARLRTHLRR